ncbi:MAG: hypothetical protein FIA95_16435 [Gemmatimonadetes bacterium]|nr:hypothetical protein [Gemmatimonadota bacterium]
MPSAPSRRGTASPSSSTEGPTAWTPTRWPGWRSAIRPPAGGCTRTPTGRTCTSPGDSRPPGAPTTGPTPSGPATTSRTSGASTPTSVDGHLWAPS